MKDEIRTFVQQVDRSPTPDLWPDVGSRAPRPLPPTLPTSRRVGLTVVALGIGAAAVALAYGALRAGVVIEPTPDPSPVSQSPSLTGEPVITAEIPIPKRAIGGGVSVGAGSAWVGIAPEQGGGPGAVLRIDLATNEVVAEIAVSGTPWRKRIVATEDAVWVASPGVIERIDPDTDAVVARVDLSDRTISAMAADRLMLWAVTIPQSRGDFGEHGGRLVRIDPATNAVVADIPLGNQVVGYEDEVRIGDGVVWVLGVRWIEQEDAEYGSDLIRVDPGTNEIVARIPVNGFGMVVGMDDVWVYFPEDGVFDAVYKGERGERWLWAKVNVDTNQQSEPFEFEAAGLRLVTPEALWSVGYDQQENVRVSRFVPTTLELAEQSEPIRSLFHDSVLDPTSGTVWISAIHYVVRLDIV